MAGFKVVLKLHSYKITDTLITLEILNVMTKDVKQVQIPRNLPIIPLHKIDQEVLDLLKRDDHSQCSWFPSKRWNTLPC